jgi:transposase
VEELKDFIASNPDPRELKRAVAVQMVKNKISYARISEILGVSKSFIGKWKQSFEEEGLSGLTLKYQGSRGYLDIPQKQSIVDWLQQQKYWHLEELIQEIENRYKVVFASRQSYYDIFKSAGISWKKTQKSNPKKDLNLVQKKRRDQDLVRGTQGKDNFGKVSCIF